MGFEIWKNSVQYAQFIVLLVFTPLGVAVTVLRVLATRQSSRKAAFEDWMALVAALFASMTNVAGLVAISILNGRDIATEFAESPSDYKNMRKWDMAGLYFYFAHTLSVKFSVLALYHRIFRIRRERKIWIYLLGAAQTVLFIIFCIFQALQCRPINKYWDLTVEGDCKDEGTVILGGELPNSLVDFGMVIYAMIMIRPIQLPAGVKLRLQFLFGIGALVGIIGFIKIAITYSTEALYAFSMVSLWTCVQMFASLLCCCLPVLYHMLPTASSWGRLPSRMLNYVFSGFSSNSRTSKDPTIQRSGQKVNFYRPTAHQDDVLKSDSNASVEPLARPTEIHLGSLAVQGPQYNNGGLRERDLNIV